MFKASQILSSEIQKFSLQQWKKAVYQNYQVDETQYLQELIALAAPSSDEVNQITAETVQLIQQVRSKSQQRDTIESFLHQYSLDTEEGVVLMCLAEALLRIPDANSANNLIKDKLSSADWSGYLGKSESWLVNASSWGLVLTGKFVTLDNEFSKKSTSTLNKAISKAGEPVIRGALNQVMKFMGKQFVLGRNIKEALKRGKDDRKKGYTHSFDMLGEAAFTETDALKYLDAYYQAIEQLAADKSSQGSRPASISIKLSALHPRYESAKQARVLKQLGERLGTLAKLAKKLNIAISIDAEEADRLELSLSLFEQLYQSDICEGWEGLGMVVQAYSKRALPVLGWLTALSRETGRKIPVRLVKGAYWDSEIKWAQQTGQSGYPVFTRKAASDISYTACAKFLFSVSDFIFPQFATHNAQTICSILQLAGEQRDFEFQRLHGMGEALYGTVMEQQKAAGKAIHCRIYAPVGLYNELLPYLVRRLLENGANSSFVHQLVDETISPETLAEHPITFIQSLSSLANQKIPLPPKMYGPARINSQGTNLNANVETTPLLQSFEKALKTTWHASPIIAGEVHKNESERQTKYSPSDTGLEIGSTVNANEEQIVKSLTIAHKNHQQWRDTDVAERADCLRKAADLMELNSAELMALCTLEAGKTIQDGIDEIREAVDFLRYYAKQAETDMEAIVLPGPTGQKDTVQLQGRGVFACISPWNFPLAIFTGQIAAALASGNAVITKPAGQTTLVGYRAVQLLHQAGVPNEVLHFVPCRGSQLGKILLTDKRLSGVAFTGSTDTAVIINQTLAARADAPIGTLIAETGGQNAMIVDSSALPEQVVADVMRSAFTSAGQRCSALRLLYIQQELAPRVLELLQGAMAEWQLGNPALLETDSGPVIDSAAKGDLQKHIDEMHKSAKFIAQSPEPPTQIKGYFLAPIAFEINHINDLKQENFGPILHVIRFQSENLNKVIDEINDYGYGLTLGIHSRNEGLAKFVADKAKVGNIYINRDMIGAVVGVQPFGGQGLSGTGPKAGGPFYLHRFCTEKTISNNTAAIGGNTTLLALTDE